MKNIGNYRNDADFKVEIYPNVFWIPLNTLGKTHYTNEDVISFVSLSPEEKRAKIGNLYEAIQLFQLSSFRGVFDNINYVRGNFQWQIHKDGKNAVISNEGCCATDTNWLAYMLEGKYESIGSFCYANTDGNGHITTYIKHEGWYYFIDMMMCRADSQPFFSHETGRPEDLFNGEWAGFLYKCKDPLDFCHFNMDRFSAKNRSVPFGFYLRENPYVSATGARTVDDHVVFCLPSCDEPRVIFIDEKFGCGFEILDSSPDFVI